MSKNTFAWLSSDTVAVKMWFSNCNAKPLMGVNTVRSGSLLVLCMAGRERASALPWGRTECPRLLRSTTRAAPKIFETFYLEKNWKVEK